MDRLSRPKNNKETLNLIETLYHKKLIDIYRTFHPKIAEKTLLSIEQETFYNTDKQSTLNIRLKSYQVSFSITKVWN